MVIRKLQIQKLYNGHFLIEYDVLNNYTTFQGFSTIKTLRYEKQVNRFVILFSK